ncbi:CheY-like chemotaxis protein [Bradyrhizobium sp. I1.8.5]
MVGWIVVELPVVLVVEDDDLIQQMIEDALAEGGFEPAIAASGDEAVTLLNGGVVIKNSEVRYRGACH